ncbi:hypothetical protein GCK32_017636 [Trichostrongylus colubriformis]|uniref:Uncharacterized protein n=1 Tax=Trichostrongylus colubriformis TaxID=6319 RepID=A0AAN8J2N5_TRICO
MKDENIEHKPGCWLEPDGQGRHCMCYTDFCNRLEKKAPTYPLLPDAQFLKHNPLLDYHDHNSDSGEGDGSVPMPENVLFPAAMTADPRTAGSADYEGQEKTLDKVQDRVQDLASSARLPSWMLMTMTLATSIARLLAYI